MYSLFYLRFVQNEKGQDERFWTNLGQSGKKNAWAGYAFEQVCLHHINQVKKNMHTEIVDNSLVLDDLFRS